MEHTQVEVREPTPAHEHWLSNRRLLIANGAFAIYATALAVITGHADRTWAIWAAAGYGVTTVIFWLTRHKNVPLILPMLVSLAGALAAPVTWLASRVAPTAEVKVISESAYLLLHHGTPYLGAGQLNDVLSYNPYLPVMALFGMPRALGATGLFGDPRVWLTAVSIALIWAAFSVAAPHRHCDGCRHGVLLSTVFIAASPVIAFPLAVGITDPPVIALMFLTLALIAKPSGLTRAAAALGVAAAMKATAWPAVPVLTAMLAARDGVRKAWRFAAATIVIAVGLAVLLAPAELASPYSFLQNTVLFPLGLTKHQTPAASPLPGHLLADTGMAGHWAAVGLLAAAGIAFVVWLIVRPPRDARAAAWRLAIGLTAMFTLAPATRWGYFFYPIALVGWLLLTRTPGAVSSIEIPAQAVSEPGLPAAARS
ncbi:MAG TPA: glycosyltransferase 87 family protein [Streptosporangiaceae bacterium]|nr:glycosyltransferase 87 family protein [Streptosporangiaceae bacterium]